MATGKCDYRVQGIWPHWNFSPFTDALEAMKLALGPGPHWNIPPANDPGYSTAWAIRKGDYAAMTPRKPCRKVNRNR